MTTGVRELRLWQEAVALGGDVARLMRQSCRRETRALTDQIVHTAVAVATSVADGYVHQSSTEQRDCYRRARRLLAELETQLAVARHAEIVAATGLAPLMVRVGGVSRLLGGYLSFIDRQLAAEAAAAVGPLQPARPGRPDLDGERALETTTAGSHSDPAP